MRFLLSLLSLLAAASQGGPLSTNGYFESNSGQADPAARFIARFGRHSLFVTQRGAVSVLDGKEVIRMDLARSRADAPIVGEEIRGGYSNYLGFQPKDIVRVAHYSKVRFVNIYPSIDLVFYANGSGFEYDFVLKPGADPSLIEIVFTGVKPFLAENGDLVLRTSSGEVRQHKPRSFQDADGRRQEISTSYNLKKNGRVSFTLAKHNPEIQLTIDPPITYSTYLGGSNQEFDASVKTDGTGAAYVIGATNSPNFPVRNSLTSAVMATVTKYDPAGQLVYSTYVAMPGGPTNQSPIGAVSQTGSVFLIFERDASGVNRIARMNDAGDAFLFRTALPLSSVANLIPKAMAIGPLGQAIHCGSFAPGTTPVLSLVDRGAYPTRASAGGTGGYVSIIGPNGEAGNSTYLPIECGALAVKGSLLAVSGPFTGTPVWSTTATFGTPATETADYVAAISSNTLALVWVARIHAVSVQALAIDASDNVYLGGRANGAGAPLQNPIRSTFNTTEGWAAKLKSSGTSLDWATFVGGSDRDEIQGLAVDPVTDVVSFMGETLSTDLTLAAATQNAKSTPSNCPAYMVGQIDKRGLGFPFLTYFGGSTCVRATSASRGSLATDRDTIYVTGVASGAGLTTVNPAQATFGGGSADFFLAKFGTTNTGPACRYGLNPISSQFSASGGMRTFNAFAIGGASPCPITAVSNSSFLTINSGSSGVDFVTVTYTVAPNGGPARTGTIAAGDEIFTVFQDGSGPTLSSISPNPVAPGPVTLTINGAGFDPATVVVDIAGFGTVSNVAIRTKTPTQLIVPSIPLQAGSFSVVVRNGFGAPPSNAILLNVTNTAVPSSHFVPIAPCRAADTRTAGGLGPISGVTSRQFGFSNCGVPATATAVALNVTLVPNGQFGFLSIWPTGQPQPVVSTMNSLDGRIKANGAIVGLGTNQLIDVYVTDTAHVILDVNGYFVPAGTPGALAFYPVAPCRVVDTRVAGGGGIIAANSTRRISGGCLPANAQAYSLNVTTVPNGPLGFLTLWPDGSAQPLASTLNNLTGTVVANSAILSSGIGGAFNAFVTDTTHLIVDLNGYFASPGQPGALAFYPLTPCRLFDTRQSAGLFGGPIMARDATRDFTLPLSGCSVPATAQAYVTNATVVPTAVFGFLTLFPGGQPRPTVSTLNAIDGALHSNAAIVPAGAGGVISIYTSDQTHLLLDISGYFAPATSIQ